MAGAQHNVGGITMVHGDGGDAGVLQEALPPGVVGIDDAAQRVARGEEHRLRLEVLLHRPVVVEVVVAEVGEHGHVKVDALDPRLDQRVARHLHGHRVTMTVGLLAVAHTGQQPLHLRGLGRRPRPRQRPHDVRRTAGRGEEVAQQLGHRRFAVGPRHSDHQQVAGRIAVEGAGQSGHDRAHGAGRDPGLHHVPVDQLRNEVLTQETDGAPVHRLGGMGVPIADVAGDAAEEVAGDDPATVVRDAAHLDRRRVADGLNHLYVVEEEVHGHAWHGRTDSVACLGHACETAAMGVSTTVT